MPGKILIVTYYWPPLAGSGVQRWLKFVKYLPDFGWKPYVCTPENPAFDLKDESLEKDVPTEAEVLRLPIWEPYHLFRRSRKDERGTTDLFFTGNKSFAGKIATFIRGNFLIPDPRIFWVAPASRFLEDFIHHEKISHLVTTGPPHSMHLIGLRLKKKIPTLQWIADFRDPWSEWHLLDELGVMRPVKKIHRHLERKVLLSADKVLTVTPHLADRFTELGNRSVVCITNGYDEEDLKSLSHKRSELFTIRHIGLLHDAWPFMEALKQVAEESESFRQSVKIEFIGAVHPGFRSRVEQDQTLSTFTRFLPYLPHEMLAQVYAVTDVLLLVIPDVPLAKAYLPGKMFEYLAAKRPVIGLGPEDGDAADVLKQTGCGHMIEWKKVQGIKERILTYYSAWTNGQELATQGAPQFSRKNLTARLIEELGR
ncbi:MAG: glycosyl transferase [Cyclobacteriaceae bacterium]|nr:glycosyl transferase [Cyclobacteriaceae bacterium]